MTLTQERNVNARKMGPTITKELGEESLFSAHRGERAQPCCSCGDHRNTPAGAEKLRKPAGTTLEEQTLSKTLLSLHFYTSSFLPALGTASSSTTSSSKGPIAGAAPAPLRTEEGTQGLLPLQNPNPVACCCSNPYRF